MFGDIKSGRSRMEEVFAFGAQGQGQLRCQALSR